MARETNRMRIKLDLTVEFHEPLATLPMGGTADTDLLLDYIARALMKRKPKGLVGFAPGAWASFGLDFRKPKKGDQEA